MLSGLVYPNRLTDWTVVISNKSMRQLRLSEKEEIFILFQTDLSKNSAEKETAMMLHSPPTKGPLILCTVAVSRHIFGAHWAYVFVHWLYYLQKLWKSFLSSIPRAGRTPRGVAHHPEAADSLWGSSSVLGPSRHRSRQARTACRIGAVASMTRPWFLVHRIEFLGRGKERLVLMLGFWNGTISREMVEYYSVVTKLTEVSVRCQCPRWHHKRLISRMVCWSTVELFSLLGSNW